MVCLICPLNESDKKNSFLRDLCLSRHSFNGATADGSSDQRERAREKTNSLSRITKLKVYGIKSNDRKRKALFYVEKKPKKNTGG